MKVIPLSEFQSDPRGHIDSCLESGLPLVVELPDHRRVAIQPLHEDDSLVDDLIEHNPSFREMLARSAASPRREFKPLAPDDVDESDD